MKLISVNVGQPQEIEFNGNATTTSIFKEPVEGRIQVNVLNLEGDRQSDLKYHGGFDMAVYAYSADDYGYWKAELINAGLNWGAFGENLTISGISDSNVCIGDIFRVGTAQLQVTKPRIPCFKLGIRFGDQGFVKRFLESRQTGFYLRVLREGQVESGDAVELLHKDPHGLLVHDAVDIYVGMASEEVMRRSLNVEALPQDWKVKIEHALVRL